MLLKDHFDASGRICFKYRSFLPLLILIFAIPFLPVDKYISDSYLKISMAISVLGLLIRFTVIGFLQDLKTSGRNSKEQVANSLNTLGAYSMVRNPLYLGNYFILLGMVSAFKDVGFAIVVTLLFIVCYERIIYHEEKFLEEKFGQQYTTWANKTPAFFPKFSLYQKSGVRFSFLTLLLREYPSVLLFCTFYPLFHYFYFFLNYGFNVKEWGLYNVHYVYLFAFGIVFSLIIKLIKIIKK